MFRSSTERLKSDLKLMQGPGPGTYEGHVVHTSFGSKHERPRRKRPMKLAAAHFHKHRTVSETPVVDMPSCLKKKKNSSGEKLKSSTETTEMSAEKKKKSITTKKREQTRPKVYVKFGHAVRLRSARKQMAPFTKYRQRSKNPGPCYYKMKLSTVGTPSFHRNAGKIWV